MTVDQDNLRPMNHLIWMAIAVVAAIVLASAALGPFQISWSSLVKPVGASVLLACAALYYRIIRNDPPVATALISTSQMTMFATAGAPLSYIMASTGLPLWDANFAIWDHHLGFDWLAFLKAQNAYPAFHTILALAYSSFAVQTATVMMALMLSGQAVRMQLFVLTFMVTTLVTIAISAIMPAQGVWGHLQLSLIDHPAITPLTQHTHLSIFHGLRNGTLRLLTAEGAEGIITFPSLHAALGLLFIFALWPVRYVRWVAVLLNFLMIASTPIDGGHYFSDVIAGMLIAGVCWTAISRIFATGKKWVPDQVNADFVAPSIAPSFGDQSRSQRLDGLTHSRSSTRRLIDMAAPE